MFYELARSKAHRHGEREKNFAEFGLRFDSVFSLLAILWMEPGECEPES